MSGLILRRFMQLIPMILFVSIVSFFLMHLAPGDPIQAYITPKMGADTVERIKKDLGLDKPIYLQYFHWLKKALQGNFGYSYVNHRPVLEKITSRLPATLGLMGTSLFIAVLFGIPLGIISAVFENKFIDNLIMVVTYIGISIPGFWFAIMLIYIFSLKLELLPSIGMHSVGVNSFLDVVKHAILPGVVLSFQNLAVITRYVRSNTIGELKKNYVRTQQSLGSYQRKILFKHVLKNVLLPIITILGMSFPQLIAGAFITETVFGWPGMGRLGISAIFSFDYPVIMAITLMSSLMLIFGNLTADILYGVVDPRIKQNEDLR